MATIDGSIQLVKVVTDAELRQNGGSFVVAGNMAQLIQGFDTLTKRVNGGNAIPVYVVSDAQIADGTFRLKGGSALPMADIDVVGAGVKTIQGAAIPVYVVSGSLAGAGGAVSGYEAAVLALSPVVYYRMNESSGTVAEDLSGNGYDGVYSNVTLANTPGPFDGLAAFFGTAGLVYMDARAAASAISGSEGALVIAIKVPEANWTSGNITAAVAIIGGSDYIRFTKESANNRIRWRRTAGGNNQIRDKDGVVDTDWIIIGLDWSESANQMIAYYNGHQEGAALAATAWGATAPTEIAIGAANLVGANEWNAWAAEVALFAAPLGAAGHETLAGSYF